MENKTKALSMLPPPDLFLSPANTFWADSRHYPDSLLYWCHLPNTTFPSLCCAWAGTFGRRCHCGYLPRFPATPGSAAAHPCYYTLQPRPTPLPRWEWEV